MYRVLIGVISCLAFTIICSSLHAQRAFPGAEGYGAITRGAYSGSDEPRILIVDNLRSDESGDELTGRGSFLWCLTRSYPRIVLFEVSGTIDYRDRQDDIIVKSGYLTVAGQTAPGEGITLRGTSVLLDFQHSDPSIAADHVIIQHIRFRAGDDTLGSPPNTRDCMNVTTNYVIIDHCTFSWSIDEIFGIGRGSNITISNNLFYEPLNYSLHHREGGDNRPQEHGFGMILYSATNLSMVKNLIAYSLQRNPLSFVRSFTMLNNMMYNPGCRTGIFLEDAEGEPVDLWYQGNVVLRTQNTDCISSTYAAIIQPNVPDNSVLYFADNICELSRVNPGISEWEKVLNKNPELLLSSTSPLPDMYYSILGSGEVEEYIMDNVGAFNFNRDASDIRVLENVQNRTGEYINSPDSLPARAYNYSEITLTNNGNFINGFDWSTSPKTFLINDTVIYLNQNCTDFNEVYEQLSPQLPDGIEAYRCYGGYYMGFRTSEKGSNASITVSGSGLEDFGIPEGTYFGSDGVGGFPIIEELHRPLTSIEGYPSENPHGKDIGNGYTNLENWLHDSYDVFETDILNPEDSHKSYQLYPNPSTNGITIEFNIDQSIKFPLHAYIYTRSGKLIKTMNSINSYTIHIDGIALSDIYLIKIFNDEDSLICEDKFVLIK